MSGRAESSLVIKCVSSQKKVMMLSLMSQYPIDRKYVVMIILHHAHVCVANFFHTGCEFADE